MRHVAFRGVHLGEVSSAAGVAGREGSHDLSPYALGPLLEAGGERAPDVGRDRRGRRLRRAQRRRVSRHVDRFLLRADEDDLGLGGEDLEALERKARPDAPERGLDVEDLASERPDLREERLRDPGHDGHLGSDVDGRVEPGVQRRDSVGDRLAAVHLRGVKEPRVDLPLGRRSRVLLGEEGRDLRLRLVADRLGEGEVTP